MKFRCLLLLQDCHGGAVPHFKSLSLPVTPADESPAGRQMLMFPLVDFVIESGIPQSPLNHKAAEQMTPGIVVKSSSAATVVHLI